VRYSPHLLAKGATLTMPTDDDDDDSTALSAGWSKYPHLDHLTASQRAQELCLNIIHCMLEKWARRKMSIKPFEAMASLGLCIGHAGIDPFMMTACYNSSTQGIFMSGNVLRVLSRWADGIMLLKTLRIGKNAP
jgi:hypothetical protein